ncbi:amidase [Polymorphospora lycopeni]|uniref:Amidase n=1 Tax=Polymorphospora lycopeni TaxID=3140240 RepID=A0ABV5D147_9ACTN
MDELLRLSAVRVVEALRDRQVSPLELLDAVEVRLAEAEPVVNALTTACLARARARAHRLCADAAEAGHPAWLAGLPVLVKDVVDVAGVPTTYGSPAYRDNVPTRCDPLVERIERRGAIVVGKTALPEFCAGADTVNELSGRTVNPVDATVSCGASSGGAAAAVAAGEIWCGHGTDTAGSIRIPAAFCGVVGLRPTPGLVPAGTTDPVGFEVHGPLARTAADAGLLFAAMVAEPVRAPAWSREPRVAFSADLGGTVPVDPEIRRLCTRAAERLPDAGYRVEPDAPDVDGVHDAGLTLLAHRAALLHGDRVDRHRTAVGPVLRAEVAAGRRVTADRLAAARRTRAGFRRTAAAFLGRYDILAIPTFGVPPWPVPDRPSPYPDRPHLDRAAAVWPLATLAPMAGCPAVTVPCGRTAAGHPVGLQLVGAPGSDHHLLRAAADVEALTGAAA